MAINFPSNPTNAQEVTEGNVTYVYNATKGYWESSEVSSGGGASITVYADMTALIAATGMSDGDQAFVTANNNLYLYSGTGWYKIATVQNDSPSAITGVDGTYSLAIDGTPTVITAVSTDPEGFPLTWSYSTSGLGSIATISQADNVFTITPSTTEADAGTFTLTLNATDGVNGAVSTNTSISLQFHILNSNYTTLLATAVDTSNNSSFTDSSTNALTLSPINAPTSSSFSPYRHGGYSTYFDGSGDYLEPSSSTNTTNFGTGDFTCEFWYYPNVSGTQQNILDNFGNAQVAIYRNSSNILNYYIAGDRISSTTALVAGAWYHVALVRSSGTSKLYINGVQEGSNYSDTTNFSGGSTYPRIGSSYLNTVGVNGYVSDLRIVKGTAVYTSAFTPPTTRLTAITNTSLLTCHLPYITDGSTNDHTVGVAGNVSTQPFSPYDYLSYDSATHGGSIYFDTSGSTATSGGSGQYVQSALSSELTLDTNDFTIDCWVYGISKARNYPRVLQIGPQNTPWGSNQLSILYKHNDDNDSICLAMQGIGGNAMLIASGPISDNQWYHVAITRSGSTFTMYINGESVGTYTSTGSATGTGDKAILIGSSSAGDSDFNGYISDLRVFNGTVVYTGNFTPPTEPVSSSAAAVHVIGTDASIIDKSQNANLKLIGNTTGSTTQVKFADTKSMYFDGSGDYAASNVLALGSDDFTIEAWIYFNTDPTVGMGLYQLANGVLTSSVLGPAAGMANSGNWAIYVGTSVVFANTGAAVASTWYHVAHVRNSGTAKLYVNGTELISTADTNIYTGTDLVIGGWYSSPYLLNGYISDFRVTKGLARYTANFTPPTEPLKG